MFNCSVRSKNWSLICMLRSKRSNCSCSISADADNSANNYFKLKYWCKQFFVVLFYFIFVLIHFTANINEYHNYNTRSRIKNHAHNENAQNIYREYYCLFVRFFSFLFFHWKMIFLFVSWKYHSHNWRHRYTRLFHKNVTWVSWRPLWTYREKQHSKSFNFHRQRSLALFA